MPLGTSADYEAKLPLFFRSCGRFSPKLWKNATFARDTGDVCSRIVPYLMPCCLISHALFHVLSSPIPCLVVSFLMSYFILFHVLSSPISCLVVAFLMPYFILFHVLSSPISCLVVSSSFAVAQPILSQISSRPRRVAADLREGHNQVQVGTQKPLPSTRSRGEGLRILVDRLHQNIKFWRDYFTSFKLLGTASNLPLPVTLYLIS